MALLLMPSEAAAPVRGLQPKEISCVKVSVERLWCVDVPTNVPPPTPRQRRRKH